MFTVKARKNIVKQELFENYRLKFCNKKSSTQTAKYLTLQNKIFLLCTAK